ncbi:hypothetical protein JCM10449v2_002132 [Rhodotorula kratochvilovae]
MEAPIPEQAAIVGSLWPDWAPAAFLEIQFLKIATEQRFTIIADDTIKSKHQHRFECGEDPADGSEYCPCSWTIRTSLRTGETTTTTVDMRHTHALPPEDSPAAREIVRDNLETAADAARELEELAQKQFAHFREIAGYRTGFTREQDCRDLTPAARQEVVVWDLKVALGEEAARAFERRMRKEERVADDYPKKSTLDLRHPTEGPLEFRLLAAAATAAPPPPSSSSSSSSPSDIPVGNSLTAIDSFHLPNAAPAPSPERAPTPPAGGPSPPAFLHNTPVFEDWAALEAATSMYAAAHGFQAAMVETAVLDKFTALGCVEEGCPWRVAVYRTEGAEWEFSEGDSWFEHEHGDEGKGGGKKRSSPRKGKGKAPAKIEKRQPKKKTKVVKRSPSPPPPGRKCKLPPPVEYSDDDPDNEIVIPSKKRSRRAVSAIPSATPELNGPYVPQASTSAAVPVPAAVNPIFAAARRADRPPSPTDSDRLLTAQADPAPAFDAYAASVAYAAAVERGKQKAANGPTGANGIDPAQVALVQPEAFARSVTLASSPGRATAHTVEPVVGPSTYAASAPVAGPSTQPAPPASASSSSALALETYLSTLDRTGAYSYLSLAPLLRAYGLNTPAQLERGVAACAGEMLAWLERDGAPKMLARMFVKDVGARVG